MEHRRRRRGRLKDYLDSRGKPLRLYVQHVGYTGQTNVDDVMIAADAGPFNRRLLEPASHRPLVIGDRIRDWTFSSLPEVLFPYSSHLIDLSQLPHFHRWVWPYRTVMGNRATFAKLTYFAEGRPWWEWHQVALERLRTPLSIAYAEVASHNHFVLDRGGKVFNRTAPVIKLPPGSSEEAHLDLVGVLNSSTAGFWLKQIAYPKSSAHGGGSADQPFTHQFAFDASKLQSFPIPVKFSRTYCGAA